LQFIHHKGKPLCSDCCEPAGVIIAHEDKVYAIHSLVYSANGIAGNSVLQSSSQAVSGELTANFALITKEQAIVLGDNSFVVQYNEQSQEEGFPQNIETLAVINQGGEVIFQGNVHLGVKDAVKYLEESMDRDGSCEFAIYIPEDEEKHKNPKADKKGIITGFIVSKYLDALINEGPLDFGDAPKRYPTYS
jgi:hypothetical protein